MRRLDDRPKGFGGLAWCALVAVTVAVQACGGDPVSVVRPPVEVFVAAGDQQYGTASQVLQTPLEVLVRALTTRLPQSGVPVSWRVIEGEAEIIDVPTTVSDSVGLARARIRLGSALGDVVVRATAEGQSPASADFRLFVIDRPALDALSAESAVPGASITLSGNNFIPQADRNVVLFSGVRGQVSNATPSELVVTVPTCLPERDVDVSVRFGAVSSSSLPLSVGSGGDVVSLEIGDVVDAFDPGGFECITVSGTGGAEFVLAVHSTSEVGAAAYPWSLFGLAAGPSASPELRQEPGMGSARVPGRDAGISWEDGLRELERELTSGRAVSDARRGGASAVAQSVPAVNDVRTFRVFRNPGDFASVTATARHVGERAALFVDQNAPPGGYTDDDLRAFSDQIDEAIWPVVTEAFGLPSDLDSNERIVILFTPVVNALTPRGAAGFIAGFFFGLDLLPDQEGSNAGEIFYALVPDPNGEFSDARAKTAVARLTPAVLSHEFQHMVNFNQRVLLLGAEANEAVWMSEALAQFAEELVARSYEDRGDVQSSELFRSGVRDRARRYLNQTSDVSLVIASGNGTLEERGAGYLYLAYLADQYGVDLVGELTRTTRTGVANVEAETGSEWPDGLSDWWTALVLDGPGPETGSFTYPSTDLRKFLEEPFPLRPTVLGETDLASSGTMRSASATYYIVDPSESGTMTFRLGGEGGGSSAPQAGLRLRIIRVQ